MLERATLLQSMERHKLQQQLSKAQMTSWSSRSHQGHSCNIAKYLYSDDAKVYRAPPYEKLLLNPLNSINYLVLTNRSGAKVEREDSTSTAHSVTKIGRTLRWRSLGAIYRALPLNRQERAKAMRFYADAYEGGGVSGLKQVFSHYTDGLGNRPSSSTTTPDLSSTSSERRRRLWRGRCARSRGLVPRK